MFSSTTKLTKSLLPLNKAWLEKIFIAAHSSTFWRCVLVEASARTFCLQAVFVATGPNANVPWWGFFVVLWTSTHIYACVCVCNCRSIIYDRDYDVSLFVYVIIYVYGEQFSYRLEIGLYAGNWCAKLDRYRIWAALVETSPNPWSLFHFGCCFFAQAASESDWKVKPRSHVR